MQIFLVVFGVVLTVFGIGLLMKRNTAESDGPSKFSFMKIVEFESRGPGIAVLFVGALFVLLGVFLPQLQGVVAQRDPVNVFPAEKTATPPVAVKQNDGIQHTTENRPASDNTSRGEVSKQPAEVAKNANTTDAIADKPQKATGEITLRYLGDVAACSLDLQVRIGDKTVRPNSNYFPVSDVPLGTTTYSINGAIACPLIGNCAASGSGNLDVENRSAYNVVWQNVGIGVCRVVLVKSP